MQISLIMTMHRDYNNAHVLCNVVEVCYNNLYKVKYSLFPTELIPNTLLY